MIYCIEPQYYPTKEEFIEEEKYLDENYCEWRIARVKAGIIIRYFGDPYFSEDIFVCPINDNEIIKVKNTNCILFLDTSFELFADIRTILKNGYTDDIWKIITELFTERLQHSRALLQCEMFK